MYLTRTSKSSKDVFVRSRSRMVCLRKKHTLLLHFDMDSSKDSRDAWVRWFDSYAPTNDNVYDYISSHPYRLPFSSFFESNTCYGRTDHWSKPVGAAADEFSSIFLSATVVALPTVRTSHTRMYPVAAYILVEDGLALFESTIISRFNQHVTQHISKLYASSRYTLVILRSVVHRRLLSNGSLPAISDRKKAELAIMISKWIAEEFLTPRFRDVAREDEQLNGKLLSRPDEIDRINPNEVTLIGDLPLSLLDMQSLLGTSSATTPRISHNSSYSTSTSRRRCSSQSSPPSSASSSSFCFRFHSFRRLPSEVRWRLTISRVEDCPRGLQRRNM